MLNINTDENLTKHCYILLKLWLKTLPVSGTAVAWLSSLGSFSAYLHRNQNRPGCTVYLCDPWIFEVLEVRAQAWPVKSNLMYIIISFQLYNP